MRERSSMRGLSVWLVLGLGAAAPSCKGDGGDTIALTAEPSHASMFGDVDVAIGGDLAGLGAITAVKVGGVHALALRPRPDGGVTVHLQGAPEAGPADIEIVGEKRTGHAHAAFSFDPPTSGAPLRWMAFGASLTHGAQSGGLSAHGQLAGYSAQVARAFGVFLAPPLVVEGLLPPLTPSDFVSNCAHGIDLGALVPAFMGTITDRATGVADLSRGRQDPELESRNPAVGGATLDDVIRGMLGPAHLIERMGELPVGDPQSIWAPTARPQLDRIRALDPDVAFSADLLENDVMPSVTASDDLHPEAATDPALVEARLAVIFGALGAMHGQYFVGSLIDVDLLPNVLDLRRRRIAAGSDTEATFDAKRDAVRAKVDAYDDALGRVAGRFPNVHVVDVRNAAARALSEGITVGAVHLTGAKFGGLLSLDHMHFSDVGYAMLANVFIHAIDGVLGTRTSDVDLAAVIRTDPYSPEALRAQGVQCP